ncbi:MAG: DNA polymerase II large subunit, partial [Minisyncoccales bacterium]
ILPYTQTDHEKFAKGKRALELIGIEHSVSIEHVVIEKQKSKALLINLGIDPKIIDDTEGSDISKRIYLKDYFNEKYDINNKNILEFLNSISGFIIKDKSGDFIGSRMGRPEKAKLRKLQGSPNVLFPVGQEGGRMRSVNVAYDAGSVKGDFPLFYCESCNNETIYVCCEKCGKRTRKRYYYSETKDFSFSKEINGTQGIPYMKQNLDIKYYFDKASENLGLSKSEIPSLIKGVKGTSSEDHIMENLGKGILRAKYGLQVNKDGTIRFDGTELPLVYFKPKEIFTSIEKLKELGYEKDIYGNELVSEEQVLELMPHDVLLPSSPESKDEKANEVFYNVCNFVDDLLTRYYGLKPFHNLKTKEDIIGELGVCMAPHNCAGVICRFIGFSNSLGLYASPFMHAAIRRDCDGDEAALMLLSDVLLNFPKSFLPSHRGGTQDAPLVLNTHIDAGEVDDQILDFELTWRYPLNLYQLAEQRKHSSEVKGVKTVKDVLNKGEDPFAELGYTHDSTDFNYGVRCSNYKLLATMDEKVQHQMELVEKLRCADTNDTARLIIERHFMRDMRGNLRKFSMQGFRCVDCNESFRRPPLKGKCSVCGGKIIFTIHEGGIKKYLDLALELTQKYNLSPYIIQTIELTKEVIDSIFGKELEKQEGLNKWF